MRVFAIPQIFFLFIERCFYRYFIKIRRDGIIVCSTYIKSFNGKLGLIEKLKFLYYRWKGVNRMRAVVMGTKKAFQKHGLESALFIKLKEYVLPLNQYVELELSWVGDFNDKMLSIHEATGATFGKRHATMRKLFK